MLRIVGLQRNESAQREFVLLQNQGTLRLQLRGHILISDSTIEGSSTSIHVLSDDVMIPGGTYVLVTTGIGESRWAKTKDGALVYYTFMNRENPVWPSEFGPVHVLGIQHSYAERPITSAARV